MPAHRWDVKGSVQLEPPTTDQSLSREVQVEPFANHFVGRVLREISGRAGFGMLATGVERKLDVPELRDLMPQRAHVLGGDGYYFFDQRHVWSVKGRVTGNWITGSAAAITTMQRASQRYFQRPDATHLHYDPAATSMKGWAGGFNFGKNSGGFLISTSLAGNSPGSDYNDSGLQNNSDNWGMTANVSWNQLHPDRFSRFRSAGVFRSASWNFNRDRKNAFINFYANIQLRNYWNIRANLGVNQRTWDDRLTRGGPMTAGQADRNFNLGFNTDGRKHITLGTNVRHFYNAYGSWGWNANVNIGLKPSSSLTLTLEPNFDRSHLFVQYVDTFDDPAALNTFGKRYVFADLDQSAAQLTSRASWSLSPRVSLQVFSQFLLSSGDFWNFKELERPRTLSFLKYGQDIGAISRSETQYIVDPNGIGSAGTFSFDDPDFNYKSLRLNAVFRWEWKPGSTMFFVWTQSRTDEQYPGAISPGRDVRALFGAPSHNVFLVKINYWLNR